MISKSISSLYPEDKEKFFNLKDQVVFNRKLIYIKCQCLNCQNPLHQIHECPYIFQRNKKNNITDRLRQDNKLFNSSFVRK